MPCLGLLTAAPSLKHITDLVPWSLEAVNRWQMLLAHAASCLYAGPGDCPCCCHPAPPVRQQKAPACGAKHPPCQVAPVEDEVHQVGVLFTPNVLELDDLYRASSQSITPDDFRIKSCRALGKAGPQPGTEAICASAPVTSACSNEQVPERASCARHQHTRRGPSVLVVSSSTQGVCLA